MQLVDREAHIEEFIRILKERYGATIPEIIDAYSESTTIPANIFSEALTPLEAIVQYLVETRGKTVQETAKLLGRRTSSAEAALANAEKKGVRVNADEEHPYRISLKTLRESGLSPAEAVVHTLKEEYELTNAEIARTIGKDPRNVTTLLRRAGKKRGEKE